MPSEKSVSPELRSILEKASDFHGHLGPFVTVGVRMGLAGLDRIDPSCRESLRIEASLPLRVPFSCVVDGLQATTKCTVGNQKLSLRGGDSITAAFETSKIGKPVIVALKQQVFQGLKHKLLTERLSDRELRKAAWTIAALPEEELLVIT
jgi:formylmethanofuran dehydrogenase subunit E